MRIYLAGAFIVAALAAAAQVDDKANATGTWKWSYTTQNGQTIDFTLKLKHDGDKLTGTLTGRGDNTIEKGSIKAGELSFNLTSERNGQKFTRTYRGKLSGDTIKGKIEFDRNGEKRSFDWEAKRE
jgi:hypothetical protein